jgi:hypothetical protein
MLTTMNVKAACAAFFLSAALATAQQPDAKVILEAARMSATLTRLDEGLSGNLRQGNRRTPVMLFLKGQDIQFQFSENKGPWQVFHMRIGDEAFNLFEIVDGKTQAFAPQKLISPVAGTDLTSRTRKTSAARRVTRSASTNRVPRPAVTRWSMCGSTRNSAPSCAFADTTRAADSSRNSRSRT